MSIELLQQRLTQQLQERIQQQCLKIILPEPHRLLRRLKEIEHTFDQQDYDIPNEDKILNGQILASLPEKTLKDLKERKQSSLIQVKDILKSLKNKK